MPKPPNKLAVRITDPNFVYVNAASTDIGRRFRKIWAEQRKARELDRPTPNVVTPIKRAK